MFDVGFAVTFEPVVAFKPVDGDHVYVFAPLTFNAVNALLQTD
jgi:hypothetical protein